MDVGWFIGVLALLPAVAFDLEQRRVPNVYWVPWIVVAAILVLSQGMPTTPQLLAAGGLILLSYSFFRFGLMGGADAKALWLLAILGVGSASPQGISMPLDALTWAVLVGPVLLVLYALGNLVKGDIALPAMFLGYRIPVHKAMARQVTSLQRLDGQTLHWRFRSPIRPRSYQLEEFRAIQRAGHDRIWVTPRIPFLLPLTLGWMVQPWFGNPLFHALTYAS